jgi:hypothetical protein
MKDWEIFPDDPMNPHGDGGGMGGPWEGGNPLPPPPAGAGG